RDEEPNRRRRDGWLLDLPGNCQSQDTALRHHAERQPGHEWRRLAGFDLLRVLRTSDPMKAAAARGLMQAMMRLRSGLPRLVRGRAREGSVRSPIRVHRMQAASWHDVGRGCVGLNDLERLALRCAQPVNLGSGLLRGSAGKCVAEPRALGRYWPWSLRV